MGRQGGDRTVVSSSIALLQERFRQLQKVREKREKKELLKLFSESERSASLSPTTTRYDPNRLSFQPEVILPYRQPHHQDSLSLGLSSYSKQTDFRTMAAIPASTSLWPNDHSAATSSTSKRFESSDVDTSLHL